MSEKRERAGAGAEPEYQRKTKKRREDSPNNKKLEIAKKRVRKRVRKKENITKTHKKTYACLLLWAEK